MRVLISCLVTAALLIHTAAAATPGKPKAGAKRRTTARRARSPYLGPQVDPTAGDNVDGDDLVIRQAAVRALGTLNGSIVVVDPNTGRVLTMVNQKLALKSGFIPCSTIKLVTSIAALSEGIVDRDTFIRTGKYVSYNLTTAIARSNNPYFATLGNRMGFEKVMHYAQMLGLGEKAGLDIEGEQAGEVPAEPPAFGGVGMMTSFGTGFEMTPLELAGLLSAIANNGTLYYLQYPRSEAEIEQFIPKVKRALEIAPGSIQDLKDGMRGAVDFGTARRASYDPSEPIFGKTGTCTDFRSSNHMGWFGSFNEVGHNQLVVVVMLAGTHALSGPMAAGVAGAFYRNLSGQRYFAADATPSKPVLPEILVTQPCCTANH